MGLFTDLLDQFLPLPEAVDYFSAAPEFAPVVTDVVYCAERDSQATVDAIGDPYDTGADWYYVIALDLSWADWVSIDQII